MKKKVRKENPIKTCITWRQQCVVVDYYYVKIKHKQQKKLGIYLYVHTTLLTNRVYI